MAVTPADVNAAFQDAIPHRRDEFARRVRERLRSIVHEDQYVARYPAEVLTMAEEELRARIELAADRVKQLINSGWTETEMMTVRKVFLDCFGMFDRVDKDPQSDLYRAVEAAFESVGQHNPPQATMNARRLSEVQVQSATEFLSDLELYYGERHPSVATPTPQTAEADEKAVAEAVSHWETDAFISHASEDKAFVSELATRLRASGVRIWIDEAEFTVGDSLRGKIDEGLSTSKYGIVILSHAFFSKDWPKLELDALVTIQTQSGRKVILPVWYGINAEQIGQYSPVLAGRYAAISSDGMAKVVNDLLRVLRPEAALAVEAVAAFTPSDGTFRQQIIEFVKETRALVLRYGSEPTDEQQYELITTYAQMGPRYHAIKHHLESKLGYRRVETLAKLPLPMTPQAILRTADLLENLAIEVPDYLPAYPVELDRMS